MTDCHITGIGTAVPPNRLDQAQGVALARALGRNGRFPPKTLETLYRRSGVAWRHSVLLEESAEGSVGQSFYAPPSKGHEAGPTTRQRMERYESEAGPLALRASRTALADAALGAEAITHLITVSCTGFASPALDLSLVDGLGLGPAIARTHIGFMGCHAAMNAARAAAAHVRADPDARVLVTAVELCSLHHQYGDDPEQVVANALFADGAASLIVAGVRSASPQRAPLRVLASGSTLFSDSSDLMAWRIGDHGFQMRLSPKVPDLVRQRLREWIDGWLESVGLKVEQVGGWAVHPGGPRVLSACQDALDLDSEALAPSRCVLKEFGNMSSPTVLFILERLRQRESPLPWVALGFGPGLSVEAMVIG